MKAFELPEQIVEERKKEQEKKKIKQFVSSIEPHSNHKLFEFHWNPVERSFSIYESTWKREGELVLVPVNGKWVNKEKLVSKPAIDIFNPFASIKKKSHEIEIKDGVGYVTALNYNNAVRKFKKLNPQYF